MTRSTDVRRIAPALLALLVLLLAGCAGPPAPSLLAVGAGSDPEYVVLAHVYAGALRSTGAGVHVDIAAHPLAELDSGAVSVVPGFTGRLLRTFSPGATVRSDKQVYRAMVGALPEGIAAGDYATAAEDKPALAVTGATAKAWGGDDLTVLAGHCRGLVVGSVPDVVTPSSVGRCRLPVAREYHSAAELFDALRVGQVVAGWTTTANPDRPSDFVVLADRKPALVQAENVVPLYRRNELTEPQLLAINQVAGVLDTASLVDMRRQVAAGADPAAVAGAWLAEHPLGR